MTRFEIIAWQGRASQAAFNRVLAEHFRAECFWQFEAKDLRAAAVLAAIEVAVIAERFGEARMSPQ